MFVDDLIYFVFTGCEPNVELGYVEVIYNAEFLPDGNALPVCPLGEASPGNATQDF